MQYNNILDSITKQLAKTEETLKRINEEAQRSISSSYLDSVTRRIAETETALQRMSEKALRPPIVNSLGFTNVQIAKPAITIDKVQRSISASYFNMATRTSKYNEEQIDKLKEHSSQSIKQISNEPKIIKYILRLAPLFLLFLNSKCQEHLKDQAQYLLKKNNKKLAYCKIIKLYLWEMLLMRIINEFYLRVDNIVFRKFLN